MDIPAGVTQEQDRTGFLHLPSAVLALSFLARRIQSFLSLVDHEVGLCVLTISWFSTYWVYCERSDLLICKVHQCGLGCIKTCAR